MASNPLFLAESGPILPTSALCRCQSIFGIVTHVPLTSKSLETNQVAQRPIDSPSQWASSTTPPPPSRASRRSTTTTRSTGRDRGPASVIVEARALRAASLAAARVTTTTTSRSIDRAPSPSSGATSIMRSTMRVGARSLRLEMREMRVGGVSLDSVSFSTVWQYDGIGNACLARQSYILPLVTQLLGQPTNRSPHQAAHPTTNAPRETASYSGWHGTCVVSSGT
jgi:hypothetical protein